jgi:uncharacterized protein YqeY
LLVIFTVLAKQAFTISEIQGIENHREICYTGSHRTHRYYVGVEGEKMARQEFPLEQQLRKDIQAAQRARDQLKVDTLRMALGAIHNLEVARTDRKNPDHGKPLTEGDTLKVLEQEVKKRNQAIPLYKQGGRDELAEKEQRELDILQAYLQGSQLSDDEVRAIVTRLVSEQGREFRKVMPLAAKETKGKAEGARVQRIVKEMTQ